NTAFTAALVNLEVKGHVQIAQTKNRYVLQRNASLQPLGADERALYDSLFSAGQTLELVNRNHGILGAAQHAHARALKALGDGRYYLNNTRYLLPSLLACVALFIGTLVLGAIVPLAVVLFIVAALLHIVFGVLLRAPT